jgi:hypothetical protein
MSIIVFIDPEAMKQNWTYGEEEKESGGDERGKRKLLEENFEK